MATDETTQDTSAPTGDGAPSTSAAPSSGDRVEVVTAGASFGQRLARVLWLVIVLVFAAFAAFNAQSVDFSWIVGETTVDRVDGQLTGGVPLIVLMVGSFALGALVAWMASWRSRRKQLKQLRRQQTGKG